MTDPAFWRRAVVGLTVFWITALAVAVALRIGFPLELEWMEGGSLQHAHWIQRGSAVYPPPSADFVPFLYTPLYAVVLAGLGSVLPLGFVLGRLGCAVETDDADCVQADVNSDGAVDPLDVGYVLSRLGMCIPEK